MEKKKSKKNRDPKDNESGPIREGTGIKEVDSMVQGGFPNGSIVGLSGPPGVGKSIFSLHFILEGARRGQKCVYINLEEPRKNIDNMIGEFDFAEEFFELEKKGLNGGSYDSSDILSLLHPAWHQSPSSVLESSPSFLFPS